MEGRILVTGASGFLGRHIVRKLLKSGTDIDDIHACNSRCHDLLQPGKIAALLNEFKPDVIIHAAGKVGGIGYNQTNPADLFYNNLAMGIELMRISQAFKVKKFVNIGTVCAYPKFTPVPFKEDDIWNGYPEETNAPFGLAKKMLLVHGQALRRQYGFNSIYLLLANLYGPGDHFDQEKSHVIPALIYKISEAKAKDSKSIKVWGTGKATREFLYVEDAADAILMATEKYDKEDPVNIGTGKEISILDLVEQISNVMDWHGLIEFDTTKPDGQPKRHLDVSRAKEEFGFEAQTPFAFGLGATVEDYMSRVYDL